MSASSRSEALVAAVSYNIHSAVGRDRRYAPERIWRIIDSLAADIIGLQEVDARPGSGRVNQFLFFAERSGMHCISGPNIVGQRGHYGNMLLSAWPIEDARSIALPVELGREPRGAICARLRRGRHRLQVLNTHFGLRPAARRAQAARLRAATTGHAGPTLYLGDFNVWRQGSAALRMLDAPRDGGVSPRTFPSGRPLLALDRIWTVPGALLVDVAAVRNELTLLASDHLPLRATLRLPREFVSPRAVGTTMQAETHDPLSTLTAKPARLPEGLGMYVDALRKEHSTIEQVWVLRGPGSRSEARWELLFFADESVLAGIRADSAAQRDDVELLVVVDGDRFESAWVDGRAGRLTELRWRLEEPQAARYRRASSGPLAPGEEPAVADRVR